MLALRITVSAVMLGILLSRIHLSSLLPDGQASTVPWLLAALGVWVVVVALSVLRWHRVLIGIDLPAQWPALASHTLAGLFVSSFLPSTIGGDVLRVVRLSSDTADAPASFASVALERLTGFVVLPVISLAALALSPSLLHHGAASKVALGLDAVTLVALAGILAATAHPRLGGRLAGHASWLRFVGAVHLGIERIRRHPKDAAAVMLSSFAYQLAIIVAAFAASRALGITVGWLPLLAFIPVVATAQVLPVSVGGLGLREGALVLLLTPLGVGAGQATALGLLLYGINLVVSLAGAPAFAMWSKPERVAVMAE